MKLFPHTMIRISGGPFEKLETLNLNDSIQMIDSISGYKEKLTLLKQTISDKLYQIIPEQKDPDIQNRLLKIRRDIFNERSISAENVKHITSHLPESLAEEIENYRQIKEKINELWQKGETLFPGEVTTARQKLRALAEEEDLQKGLLLSSQSLFKRIPGYVKKEPHKKMKKKDFQTERGLTKYISRMYGKTSPFSTFTNLVIGKITAKPEPQSPKRQISPLLRLKIDEEKKPEVLNHIRLNNYLYKYLKLLLTKNPNMVRHFLIRPNPTLKKNEDHYLFLTNVDNIEAFQRIPANPALEVFLTLASEKKEGIVYKELVHTIVENEYIDASAEDLENFINQLIDYGFLEFNIGVSGIDPDWDHELTKKLKPLSDHLPLIKELLNTLKTIRMLAEQYGITECENRLRILDQAFQQFRTICMKLHEDAGLPEDERKSPEEIQQIQAEKRKEAKKAEDKPEAKIEEESAETDEEEQPFKQFGSTYFYFKPENMFYEDTSLNISLELDEQQVRDFTDILHQLLQKMKRFEGHFDERNKMLHYFVNKYGKNASVDLLTFYEDYYREFKKPEAKKLEKKEMDDLPRIPAIEKRQEQNKQWMDQLKSLLEKRVDKTDEVVNVTLRDLEETDQRFTGQIDAAEGPCSYGSFVHFFVENTSQGEKLMGVLSASFPGFGKMFSRFLHIFDDAVTQDIRKWNASLLESKENPLFLEDSDASYFNANLHPPLMPFEIRTPNGQNSLPPEKQIPITELQVQMGRDMEMDETDTPLQLIHTPTQKRVFVFDLGFQGHLGRSQLFQLLEKFTLAEYLFCHPMLNAINSLQVELKKKGEPEVQRLPRVVFQDRIILQRKTWYIPKGLLPFRTPEESDWAWFCRVNEWRRHQGIPEEIFIFVIERSEMQNLKPEIQKKVSRDDYKPQYISFKNPFLINLLGKSFKRVPYRLKIVEMLPNSQQLLRVASNRYITEFVLQWYQS
jgi:hypothetical protein